jgi:transcriptional regulator with PAS, ATPase and Fis domain
VPCAAAADPADALAALDTRRRRLHACRTSARRVVDKPIALLLLGESGVGKEVLARAVHASGPRRTQALRRGQLRGAAGRADRGRAVRLPAGAFTGAAARAPGRLREADGGTCSSTRSATCRWPLQARLLRVLQERQVTAAGRRQAGAVDFRWSAPPTAAARGGRAGRFRTDLYYRINGLTLQPAAAARAHRSRRH